MGAAENGDSKPGCSKHIPRSRKASSSSVMRKQQPRSESMRSPVLVKTTKSIPSPSKTSDVCSKRMTESLVKPDSFKEEESEKVIKIEER